MVPCLQGGGYLKEVLLIFCFIFVSFIPFSHAAEIRTVAILLDVSKSVSPEEFERIKGMVQELIGQDFPPDQLSLYTFGNKLKKIDRDQLHSVQATESNTIFYDAAYDAMQDLAKRTADTKTILIFSDGIDTKSVIVPEDVVSYARDQRIAIHCIGIGKANRKLMERIAKLTGGSFFTSGDRDVVSQIKMATTVQKQTHKAEAPQQKAIQATRPAQPSAVPPALPMAPAKERSVNSYLWIAVILGAVLVVGGMVVHRRHKSRTCPTCARPLESYQTICPDCPGQTIMQPAPDLPAVGSQELNHKQESLPSVPTDRKQDTQEMLSKTYFLIETPVLVVQKGNNVGESYPLSKEAPVSIGRSRLNEIRPDDGSISAQHCRIIPENGEYVVYDLGSTNGTIVNNISVNKAVLEEGDTIKVGATVLLFTLQQSPST